MPLPPEGLPAAELVKLTADDLKGVFPIPVKDLDGLSHEQVEELRLTLASIINSGAVTDQSRNISLRPPSVFPPQPTRSRPPTAIQYAEWCRNDAYEAYDSLIQMGGRPTQPINPNPRVWDPARTSEDNHVRDHWTSEARRCYDELEAWEKFRRFQTTNRQKGFPAYHQAVSEYRQTNGIGGSVQLHLQPEEQTKLDEWKEYQFYERFKLDIRKKAVDEILRLPASQQKQNGDLFVANRAVEKSHAQLDWIQGQFPLIASELLIRNEQPSRIDRQKLQKDQQSMIDRAKHLAISSRAQSIAPGEANEYLN
ncbi:MAG: hypothetical protein M1837_001873 [Sclerophora amabilis]|nr:MAG: hypothetical protein M1837_001873 [Sclerophora amabilis]